MLAQFVQAPSNFSMTARLPQNAAG